jgi:UPF0755 protein
LFGSNRSQSSHERTAQERERAREERERRRSQRATGASDLTPASPVLDGSPPAEAWEPSSPPEAPEPAPASAPATVPSGIAGQMEPPPPAQPVEEEEALPAFESGAAEAPVEDWLLSDTGEHLATAADPPPEDPPGTDLAFQDAAVQGPEIEHSAVEHPAVEHPAVGHPEVEHPEVEHLSPPEPVLPDPDLDLPVESAAIDLDPVEIPVPVKLPAPASPPERLPPLPSGGGRRGRRSDPLLQSRASRLRAHRSSERKAGGRITRARIAALLVLVVVIAVVWFLSSLFQPFAGSGGAGVIVSIPKGSSSSEIGKVLADDGVVSSAFFFEARALLEGKRGELHSGRFRMRRDMSFSAAIDVLSKPPPKVIAVKVVIPEGETRAQIAEIAHADGLSGSYLAASLHSTRLKPTHYGAHSSTPNLEGFLFPATYELHAGTPASVLVEDQLTAFRAHFGSEQIHVARTLHLTSYELLTVASMIEREAEVSRDRPLVAAVIYNRLRLGMTLGIDATLRYALHDYSEPLTEAQLHLNSPYNTRLHTGLPPTPISNPGAASIEAATHPAHVSYLYYVAAANGCGAQVFSTSYAQFQQNAAAYQRAIAKNHGRVPTCKKK